MSVEEGGELATLLPFHLSSLRMRRERAVERVSTCVSESTREEACAPSYVLFSVTARLQLKYVFRPEKNTNRRRERPACQGTDNERKEKELVRLIEYQTEQEKKCIARAKKETLARTDTNG